MRIQILNRSLVAGLLLLSTLPMARAGEYQIFARTNLMAWCIVPFDAKKRGPEERAAMLEQLGFKMCWADTDIMMTARSTSRPSILKSPRAGSTAWAWMRGGSRRS